MLSGQPFPRLHAKTAETKGLLKPVSDALLHFADQDPGKREVLTAMVQVLELSISIDVLIDDVKGYKCTMAQGNKLEELVQQMNEATSRLCRHFLNQGLFFFNFVPKNHYLFHLAQLGKHMSPKLAWCYKGEDLMNKIKTLAQGSFRGTPPRKLGNKILGKYLVGVAHALAAC